MFCVDEVVLADDACRPVCLEAAMLPPLTAVLTVRLRSSMASTGLFSQDFEYAVPLTSCHPRQKRAVLIVLPCDRLPLASH